MSESVDEDFTIQALDSIDAIRRRPDLYLGPSNRLNQLLRESLCLSLAEVQCGTVSKIEIRCEGNHAVVRNDGIGLPVGNEPDRDFVELLFTRLHACRTHNEHKSLVHNLCQVGIVAVNAFSDQLIVSNYSDGTEYCTVFERGVTQGPTQVIGETLKSGLVLDYKVSTEFISKGDEFESKALLADIESMNIDLSNVQISFENQID